MACNYNCADTPAYDNSIEECGALIRLAGADTMVLLECDHGITDASDSVQIQAAIDAGRAHLLEELKIGFDEPSPVNAPAKRTSCGTIPIINYTRGLTIEDYKITTTNNTFWDVVKGRVYGGAIIIACSTDGLSDVAFFIDEENVSISSFMNNGNDNDQAMFFTAKLAWKSLSNPDMVAAPTGLTA
jgi:hypothetical protein